MAKKNEETLTDEETEEEKPSEEESSEETTSESTPPPPNSETMELFNSVREEVGGKRFDGLMKAWQEDRRRMMTLENELANLREAEEAEEAPEAKVSDEDNFIDYVRTKIKERDRAETNAEDEVVARELEAVRKDFPDLEPKSVLDYAIKHSRSEENPMDLHTAASIMTELLEATKGSSELSETEKKRKKEASGISGKTGITQSEGLKPYDSEKDKDKSYQDLGREGAEEVGME